jgi:hypothetical protein
LVERGVIRNREYSLQVKDFSGLRWGNITPTDIDIPEIPLFIDFGNRLFIWGELKHGVSEPTPGQRLAFERICDACERGKVPTYFLIAKHNDTGDINVAVAIVSEYRHSFVWKKTKRLITVREVVDILRTKHLGEKHV